MNLGTSLVTGSDKTVLAAVQDDLEHAGGDAMQAAPTTPGEIEQDG